jgi:hypothetical protein
MTKEEWAQVEQIAVVIHQLKGAQAGLDQLGCNALATNVQLILDLVRTKELDQLKRIG